MTTVTVYSKPACVQCNATYRALDDRGVEYSVVDVSTNEAALEFVTNELEYRGAPVVVVDDEPENHWSGFRPDKIEQLQPTEA